jgi:flagellar basal-body rod modification protein FlgD
MAIDAIGRVADQDAGLSQAAVGLDDFLEIFLAQLNFQDPLEPVDNREFIAQLAQFSSLELANQTNDGVSGLLEVQSITQSVGLLGKEVQVSTNGGSTIGEVVAIRLAGNQPVLSIKTADGQYVEGVSPANVVLVR